MTNRAAAHHALSPTRPHLQLITMTDPTDERESTPTMTAPPPSSERHTLPPPELSPEEQAEVDELERAALERARSRSAPSVESIRELVDQVMVGIDGLNRIRADLLEPEGQLAQRQRDISHASQLATVEQIAKLIDSSEERKSEQLRKYVESTEKRITELADELRSFSDVTREKDAEQDAELAKLRTEMADAVHAAVQKALAPFAARLAELEKRYESHAPARPPTAPAAPTSTEPA